jgi:phosphate transport system permease protein
VSEQALSVSTTQRQEVAAGLRMKRLGARAIREQTVGALLLLAALVSILTTAGILYVLVRESVSFFQEVSPLDFFFGTRWTPLFASKSFGVLPLLSATLLVSVIALAVAIPFGLGSAIYLAEFAPSRARAVLKPMLEVLAGIPTVVYGYFALLFITPLLRGIFPEMQVFNALSAGIAMGIMIIPMVASLSEDAISSVPRGLRDAASAVGATDMEKIIGVTIPAALSGIIASFILAMSRAVGETMIVAIAAGNAPELVFNPLQGMQTMTAYIVQVSLGDTPRGTIEYYTIFAVGATLFVMTLILNILSRMVVRKFREVYD